MSIFRFLKSKTFFKQIAIAIVAFFVFIFALQWWFGVTTNHDQKIKVPDLQKMALADVEKTLKELHLDFIVIDSARFNPAYPSESVIEQNPEAGDFVKEKRKIYLTLNPVTYRDVEVPDLRGKTKRQAVTHLLSIGFKIGKTLFVNDIGKNVVRGMKYEGENLREGDKLPKNTAIDLIVGNGKR